MTRTPPWLPFLLLSVGGCAAVAGLKDRDYAEALPGSDPVESAIPAPSEKDSGTSGAVAKNERDMPNVVASDVRAARFSLDARRVFVTTLARGSERPRIVSIDRATREVSVLGSTPAEGSVAPADIATTAQKAYWLETNGGPMWWRAKDGPRAYWETVPTDGVPRNLGSILGAGNGHVVFLDRLSCVVYFDEEDGFSRPSRDTIEVGAADQTGIFGVSFGGTVRSFTYDQIATVSSTIVGSYAHNIQDGVVTSVALDAVRVMWFDGRPSPGALGRIYAVPRTGGVPEVVLDNVPYPVVLRSDGTTLFILEVGGIDDAASDGRIEACAFSDCVATRHVARAGLHGASWMDLDGSRVVWSEVEATSGRILSLEKVDL